MSKTKGNGLFWGNDVYWANAQYNARLYSMFRQQIISIAMSRFRWVNLPASCDERYLEFTLLTQGCATIAYPKSQKGIFYSTQVANTGRLNVYDNPVSWLSVGNNGWRFPVTHKNGVLVWDNTYRVPIINWIDIWARELVDIMKTMQMNRMHQKVPYILKGPQEKKFDMVNLYKQIAGGEPAVLATNGIDAVTLDVLNTEVPFYGKEFQELWQNQWNVIYQGLGIKNLPFKRERQVVEEVYSYSQPTDLMAEAFIEARRAAVDKLNMRFEEYLVAPVEVVWREDNVSANFNYMNNIAEQEGDDDDTSTNG